MSNPYKEIAKKVADYPYFVQEYDPAEERELCFYCCEHKGDLHRPHCLHLKAKTLLDQNPDSEEVNPCIPCSEGLPEEEGEYEITLKTLADFSRGEFDWSEYSSCGNDDVVSWRPKHKEPPAPTPEPDSKYKTKVIGTIKKEGDRVTVEPIPEPEKPQEPTPDPLMGWTPVWKQKPDKFEDVRVLIESPLMELSGWLNGDGMWRVYYTYNKPALLLPEHKIVAWRDSNPIPNPELFEKPTSPPPKHLPPTLEWKRLSEELPRITGHYSFFHETTNKRDLWYVGDVSSSSWVTSQYKNYTHWALVKEEG